MDEHFQRFLSAMEYYLYDASWYTQSMYVKKCKTFDDVEKYLTDHCYSRSESAEIVAKIKLQTL